VLPAKKVDRSLLRLALPSLVVLGGLGACRAAFRRFKRRRLFLPDRYPNGVWQPSRFGLAVVDVWFQSEDGLTLHGWWMPHPRATGTILYCHGTTGNIAHQIDVFRHLRLLKTNGFAFDYRGYGRSEGEPSEEGLYRDVRAAYDYLTGELDQPAQSIVLFGHSLGGAVAIDCAIDRQVAGLIVESTFTHLKDATRSSYPSLPMHLLVRRQFHSLEKVRRLTVPTLFIHGGSDATLPLEHTQRLFREAPQPKQLYVVPRAGHNDVYRYGGSRYLRKLRRFRNRCLAAAAT